MTRARAGYGTWDSPITSEAIVAGGLRFGGVQLNGEDCYWVEGRAAEGGRNVLVRRSGDGAIRDLTPSPLDVRTRVHEYGGGAFTVDGERRWFVSFADQALYEDRGTGSPLRLAGESGQRFADLAYDAQRDRLICVVEDHRESPREPRNYLAGIARGSGEVRPLVTGHDFFSSPALSPDGERLAWLSWDHPRMPWDGTELWIARLDRTGGVIEPTRVAGGESISVFQPAWSPDGVLHFVADPDGWWNLYRIDGRRVSAVHEGERELGRPQWVFGMRTYGFHDGGVVAAYAQRGRWHLGRIAAPGAAIVPYDLPYRDFADVTVHGSRALFTAGAPERVGAVVLLDLDSGRPSVLRSASDVRVDPRLVSLPQPVDFPTSAGDRAHALYYAPRNPAYEAPAEERPPLIVMGHGGPTGAASATLNPTIQYWTSRGFAVLDVNYRGSTGYGRAYRDRLRGMWGVFDVADCVHGARYLVDGGLADPARLAIRGGSAGGYTTLAALTFHDLFTAGASYYGIGDLESLARDTHKFESRYLDQLVGPYPAEQARYRERSPIHHTERLSCPVIFFQGLEDKVVPPGQATQMVAALQARGVPVAYLPFEGEQHGFRKAETIRRTLEAELAFYGRIFGFVPAGDLPVPEIRGLQPG